MAKPTRPHRDHYLDRLADEPLFSGVPGHLIPTIGRIVDLLCLAPGVSTACEASSETIIVTEGHALLTDPDHQLVSIVGPGGAIGHLNSKKTTGPQQLTAIASVRGYVIARRELPTLIAIAPNVLAAVAHAGTVLTLAGTAA